jgi:hypothetical protein
VDITRRRRLGAVEVVGCGCPTRFLRSLRAVSAAVVVGLVSLVAERSL